MNYRDVCKEINDVVAMIHEEYAGTLTDKEALDYALKLIEIEQLNKIGKQLSSISGRLSGIEYNM